MLLLYTKQFEMRRILPLLVLTVIAISAHGEKSYFDLVGEADKSISQNQWADAESYLLDALELEPRNPSNALIYSNLGIVRFNQGRDSLALVSLNEAHRLAPASVVVLDNRARVLQAVGDVKSAYRDYGQIIQLDSTLVEPRFMHAMIAITLRDMIAAEDDIAALSRLSPKGDEATIARASLYQSTAQFDKAIEQYSILLERQPTAAYYGGRAVCYLMQKEFGLAADDIAAGLKLDETDGDLYLYRAYLHKLRYQARDAENDMRRAISLGVDAKRAAELMK